MENFTFNQLRYFYKLAQTLNYSTASKLLYISQPALSKQIKDLENILKVKLFKKKGRNIVLTNAGQELVIHVVKILQDVKKTNQSMKRFSNVKEAHLNIGVSGDQIFYSIMDQFKQKYPHAQLHIKELPSPITIDKIKRHQLDAGIVFLPIYGKSLNINYIFSDEVMAVVFQNNTNFQGKDVVKISQLTKLPIAVLEKEFYLRELLDDYFQRHLILPDYQFELQGYNSCINIIKNSNAVTFIPKSFLNSDPFSGIKVMKIEDGMMPIRIGLVYLKENNLAQSIQELLRELKNEFKNY